ncbi:MAG: hypothetical protein RL497_1484 [Pseudomonadota bacterium]
MSLSGIVAVYFIIKNKSIENASIDKIIELGKWFVVSVAVTLSASIVNDGFREREQDIKEIQVFDRYTNIILEADSLEKRKLLCEYFASVSPDGRIKKSWERYKAVVDGHVTELREAEKKALVIAKKAEEGTASPAEIEEKTRLVEKVSTLNQSLISTTSRTDLKPRVYFHIRDESQRAKAQHLADEMEGRENVIVPGVRQVDVGPTVTELRYFKNAEEQEAKKIASSLTSLGLKVEARYVQGVESSNKIRPRHYELWISSGGL